MTLQDGPIDGDASTGQGCTVHETHLLRQVTGDPAVHQHVLGERTVLVQHAQDALVVVTVRFPLVRTPTVVAVATLVHHQPRHGPVALFEVLDLRPHRHHRAHAFV